MMKKGKYLAVALAGMLAIGGLTACGSKGSAGSAGPKESIADRYTPKKDTPAWKLDKKKKVTNLTWYLNADWWVNTDAFGKDMITKKLEKDLNVKIKFVTGDNTKLNTYFASGDMPDIITIDDMTSSTAKKAASWAWSLNDLSKKYDPYFLAHAAKKMTLDWYKLKDGKSYGYPNFSNTQDDFDKGYVNPTTAFVVRNDVYKAIGEPSMKTPEEFLAALKKIHEKFPDLLGFGFNSVIEGASAISYSLQDYLGVPVKTKSGAYYDRNLDPDYLKWVQTINTAYRRGYLSDDTFSDDTNGFTDKLKAGKYATIFMDGTTSQASALQSFIDANKGKKYVAIDGPQSTMGRTITLRNSGVSGWMNSYITKKAKDPAKVMQLFTYLTSKEGMIQMQFGIKNKTYTVNSDGKLVIKPEVTALQNSNPTKYTNTYNLGSFYLFANDRTLANGAANSNAKSVQQFIDWGKGKVKSNYLVENVAPDQGTQEAKNYSNINTTWNTSIVSMIRAKNDKAYDAALAAYKKAKKQYDYAAIQKIMNQKMKQNIKKLGLKE